MNLIHLGFRHQVVLKLVWEEVENLNSQHDFVKIRAADGNKMKRSSALLLSTCRKRVFLIFTLGFY